VKDSAAEAISPLDAVSATLVQQPLPAPDLALAAIAASAAPARLVERDAPKLANIPSMVVPISRARQGERELDGGPLSGAPVFVMPPQPRAAKRDDAARGDTTSAWGRTVTLVPDGSPPQEAVRVMLDIAEPVTLTIAVLQPPPPFVTRLATTQFAIWALVDVGNGSTTSQHRCRADYLLDVPLVCTFLSVRVYIGDPASGKPISGFAAPEAQVSCRATRGVRGLPGQATQFDQNVGANFGLGGFPQKLASITAHLTTATGGVEQWLQIHDSLANPTPAGAVPVAEFSLGTTPEGGDVGNIVRWLSGFGLSQGLVVGVSTTSGTFSASGASAWVQIERVLL
jgi:hypothetical protein